MFIGHWAPAFAAAAVSQRAPRLGMLFIGAQLVDWGFFLLATFGVEHMRVVPGFTAMMPFDLYHMPYTHSLLGTLGWAAAFALVVLALRRDFVTAGLAALVVVSHWLLDLLVHAPDLTLAGDPPRLGFGLWNHPWIAMPLEIGITLGAFAWYIRRSRGPVGPPLILITVLLAFQALNWFGPAPTQAGPLLYLTALTSFAIATGFAWWVGTTRRHKRERGW